MCKMTFCLHGNSSLIDKFHPFVYNKSSSDVFLNERFAKEVAVVKMRICLVLILSFSLLMLPVQATQDHPMLSLVQENACQAGELVELSLILPETDLAGGFVTLEYDPLLFRLTDVLLTQGNDALTFTYHNQNGKLNLLLDAAQNVKISGQIITLIFLVNEEIQPGTYPVTCTVPAPASFYRLDEDGNTHALDFLGCEAQIEISAPVLPACPARYLACQETNSAGGNFKVRLCALVDAEASLSRGTYGFTCTVTDQDGTRELTLGGSEILNEIEGGGKLYTAQSLGGQLYTATLQVCSQGNAQITIAPFARVDGQTLYGGAYTVFYQNGVYVRTETGNP